MTFSIAGRDPETGMLGVAVCTAVPGVGSLCPFVKAGVGAIATQSFVNPYLGIDGLKLLEQSMSAEEVLEKLISDDPGAPVRQLGIVDNQGRSAAFTGDDCVPWAGHQTGPNFSAQANMIVDETTVPALAEGFMAGEGKPLPERLIDALAAGDATGGDFRGRQSVALKVFSTEGYPYCELRVDEHNDPVAELKRVYAVAQQQLLPFVSALPTRDNPMGLAPSDDDEIVNVLRKHVSER